MHGGANAYHPLGDNDGLIPGILSEMCEMGLTWLKLLDRDGTSIAACRLATQYGIMPVVRLYQERPYPGGRLSDKHKAALPELVGVGARYFERGNEPNIVEEWKGGQWPAAWTNAVYEALVADWLADAAVIVAAGGYPGIDACSPGGNVDDVVFLTAWLRALQRSGIPGWFTSRAWLSVHNAGLNHPLDYPDDAVNQREHPGQTLHTHYYADGSPTGASNCIRKWAAVHQLALDVAGLDLPVLCTEGGFWPGNRADGRYPELTEQASGDLQATVLRQMQTAPAYLVAQMPWLLSNRQFANPHEGFERDAWKRIPGYGNCPSSEPKERAVMAALKAIPCQERAVSVDEVIGEVAQKYVLPLNAGAALVKAGATRGYLPASGEFDTIVGGVTYRAQVFRHPGDLNTQYIAYCFVGDWAHVNWASRAN